MNLARMLEETAAARGSRPALHVDQGHVTYDELLRLSAGFAARLRGEGIRAGDRVALLLPNGAAFVAAYFAVLRIGAIAVPLNILLSTTELDDRMARSSPRVIVSGDERARDLGAACLEPKDVEDGNAPAVDSNAEAAVILFTSGTSGIAKGAVLTHAGLLTAARNAAEALSLEPGDVVLGAAPFSHVLGQATGILSTVLSGAAIAVVPHFHPDETLRLMAHTRTTVLLGVPTMCIALCEAASRLELLPPLRIAHVGGAPVPAMVASEFERVFGAEVREGYGLTELSGIATSYTPGELRRPPSVGRPLGGTEMRIVSLDGRVVAPHEVGEVEFRGPSVIPGYWRDDEATRAAISVDGWLSTGDLGYVDGDGYLFLVDRRKELIIRGGYNVYPREVEEALYAHPDVAEAAVVGVPDERLGEEVAAAVVLRPGAALDPVALQGFVKERVAAYKYPRHVVFLDALPKGPTGKILKRELDLEHLLEGLA